MQFLVLGAGKITSIEMLEGSRERDKGTVKILGLDPWENEVVNLGD